jgi:hypothetical protein
VFVWRREKKREKEREKERERQTERQRERDRERERERQREREICTHKRSISSCVEKGKTGDFFLRRQSARVRCIYDKVAH